MRANAKNVSSFYMQGEKGAILLLARGEFVGENRGRGFGNKAKVTVWRV